MKKENIKDIPRIEIDLLKLKPRRVLKSVYLFYKSSLSGFFTKSGFPRKRFFKEVSCPVCGRKDRILRFNIDGFDYVECRYCASVYNYLRLSDKYIEQMYADGAYATYFRNMVVKSQKIRKNVIEQRKFQQINSFFDSPGRILDVGCGSGSFLKVFQEHGWDILGLEPSRSAGEYARKTYNIDVVANTFEAFHTCEKFDCVSFWGLEHLADPMAALRKAVKILSDSGVIVFESPSADSFLMRYLEKNKFGPYRCIESARHVLFFSRRSIDLICSRFKLRLAYLESNGLDVQTILPYEFNDPVRSRLRSMQQVLDGILLGDHYRVFLKKTRNVR